MRLLLSRKTPEVLEITASTCTSSLPTLHRSRGRDSTSRGSWYIAHFHCSVFIASHPYFVLTKVKLAILINIVKRSSHLFGKKWNTSKRRKRNTLLHIRNTPNLCILGDPLLVIAVMQAIDRLQQLLATSLVQMGSLYIQRGLYITMR